MMRIFLHIGLPHCGTTQLQQVLARKRDLLAKKGIVFARAPGQRNHTKLYMAMSDADHVDALRWNRGFATPEKQARLQEELAGKLASEIETASPHTLILSAEQLGASLYRESELRRLKGFLEPFSDDIRIIAHVSAQARVLARHYGAQLYEGRLAPLSRELDMAASLAEAGEGWRKAALAHWVRSSAPMNDFPEVQAPPFWLDYAGLVESWEAVFGAHCVRLLPYTARDFEQQNIMGALVQAFELPATLGKAPEPDAPVQISAAWATRMRAMNQLFHDALKAGRLISRQGRRRMLGHLEWPGPPTDPRALGAISDLFDGQNAALIKRWPALRAALAPPETSAPWQEAAPEAGFRATQYFTVFLPNIDKATAEERRQKKEALAAIDGTSGPTTAKAMATAPAAANAKNYPAPSATLSEIARQTYHKLIGTRFAPHNQLGSVDEETPAPAYAPAPPRTLENTSTGRVIVACMKNEGPYILEWIAYHRAIGVDGFLIYTNGCEDGTDEILNRLQKMGVVQHRNNDNWKGNSPQQYALNQSLREPMVKSAEWIIHIDVDEFMNVRCANGTLDDLLERVPGATNIAMTWRLFGNGGIEAFEDRPVIGQFDLCAPKYCPKPHTVWGFKTMTKNIGAYPKLSCHRPNKLEEGRQNDVLWVNGSGRPMGDEVKTRGWRSDLRTIGYDLIQLNHYALRSGESFLIKRQRGRALHVDRSIGLNYWLRMDWSYHKDITIKRNLPRMQTALADLLEDKALARLHAKAVKWHTAKAHELRGQKEFADLLKAARGLQLSEMERVASALALDMES